MLQTRAVNFDEKVGMIGVVGMLPADASELYGGNAPDFRLVDKLPPF